MVLSPEEDWRKLKALLDEMDEEYKERITLECLKSCKFQEEFIAEYRKE